MEAVTHLQQMPDRMAGLLLKLDLLVDDLGPVIAARKLAAELSVSEARAFAAPFLLAIARRDEA